MLAFAKSWRRELAASSSLATSSAWRLVVSERD
jgi:hypothetical protein